MTRQAAGLQSFIWIEKQVRKAENSVNLAFTIVNYSKRLLPYQQAILWQRTIHGITIVSISGTATIDQNAPYIVWLKKQFIPLVLSKSLTVSKENKILHLNKDSVDAEFAKHWNDYFTQNVYHSAFANNEDEINAGVIWLFNEKLTPEQQSVLSELNDVYQHAWNALEPSQTKGLKKRFLQGKKTKIGLTVLIIVILIMLIPIQLTVLAPAEVAAKDPWVVSASINGVIEKIYVDPNQKVSKGEKLFALDQITLKNNYEQAQEALKIAQEKYRRAYQHAYTSAESKADISLLQEEVTKAKNELTYSKDLLERSTVYANKAGVVIYSDPKYWLGKPIQVGERVMLLADPNYKQLDIQLPLDDMIPLEKGAKVRFFSNIDPLKPIAAKVELISYIATEQPDETLAYYVVADFTGKDIPRIGIKGTAKLYGPHVTLFYYLFRRPIAFIRQTLGM